MSWVRNVRAYTSTEPPTEFGGFWQYGRITIATFYRWMSYVTVTENPYLLFPCAGRENLNPNGPPLHRESDDAMPTGTYVLLTEGGLPLRAGHVIDMPRRREHSFNHTDASQSTDFTTRVRSRDKRCCFTGRPVFGNNYTAFEAAHIFPLGQTEEWNCRNLQRFITDPSVPANDKMNSVQQGFLCSATEHRLFDDYQLGVDPDDGYHITQFTCSDPQHTTDGLVFYIDQTVAQHFRPSDDLLRDHFLQCVLACMKATVNPRGLRKFDPEIDLGPGGFNLERDSWWASSEGKEQLEVELRGRLSRAGMQDS